VQKGTQQKAEAQTMDLLRELIHEPEFLQGLVLGPPSAHVDLALCLRLRVVCRAFYKNIITMTMRAEAAVLPTTGSRRAVRHTLPRAVEWCTLTRLEIKQVLGHGLRVACVHGARVEKVLKGAR
tara:strand:- start:19 stop:390 length:372 start_codon:yes stop_codon:yes gene_type:complete